MMFFFFARNIDVRAETGASLVIAPHPDDEALGCGLAIARARAAGQNVRVLIVTDGSAGGVAEKPEPEYLVRIRHQESIDAGKMLGLNPDDIVFLGFPDTKGNQHIHAIQEALHFQIDEFRPQQIYAPYGVDLNPDHVAVAEAVRQLNRDGAIPCPVYQYPIWLTHGEMIKHMLNPARLMRLRCHNGHMFLAAKKAAIGAHHSQITSDGGSILSDRFIARFLYGFELFFEMPTPKAVLC